MSNNSSPILQADQNQATPTAAKIDASMMQQNDEGENDDDDNDDDEEMNEIVPPALQAQVSTASVISSSGLDH